MTISLPKEKTLGIVNLEEIKALFFGPPKIGKTSLVMGFPNLILLATERGYLAHKAHVVDIGSWADFKEAVKLLTTTKHDFKTIAIDTIDILVKYLADTVCKKLNIEHISDADWSKGYDMFKAEFDVELNKLFTSDKKFGVIFISHTKDKTIQIDKKTTMIKTVVSIPNYARNIIVPKVSVVGLMRLKLVKIQDKFVEKRVIIFKPSEIEECGDRDGCLPEEVITSIDPIETYKVFANCYNKKKEVENLGTVPSSK